MIDPSFEHDDSTSEHTQFYDLIVDVEGFEGPLALLLKLSRMQKVDLRKISIMALAEQYLTFIEQAQKMRIELAADYLVMAAWLAFLKSRLLIPPEEDETGPSGDELAAYLAFQLERLQGMRDAAAQLMARDQLGRDFFARGIPENVKQFKRVQYTATLLDLMQGYARVRTRDEFRPFAFKRSRVFPIELALERLRGVIGTAISWIDLMSYLPEEMTSDPKLRRSATASTFAAALELVRVGQVEVRQVEEFATIEIKVKDQTI